jgi:hypothetical protein
MERAFGVVWLLVLAVAAEQVAFLRTVLGAVPGLRVLLGLLAGLDWSTPVGTAAELVWLRALSLPLGAVAEVAVAGVVATFAALVIGALVADPPEWARRLRSVWA